VQLTFSTGLDPESAVDISNYTLDPAINIVSAQLDEDKNFIVNLAIDGKLTATTSYTVKVNSKLQSYFGNNIDPDHATLTFKSPAS